MMKRSVAICAVAILVVCSAALRCGAQTADARDVAPASAATTSVPRLVQFNGTLKDILARPVSGVASVTFAIYAEQDGGPALWSETQNVLADSNGHFNALLGTATTGGFPSELFSTGQSRWLGITIARQPEMPRVMLASVPYAMKAGDADTLGGLPASSYITAQQLAAHGGIVAAPSTTIISSPFAATPTPATPAPAADATQLLGGNSGPQATITGTGTANYLPLWTSGSNLGVSKIYQANGGFVGINTTTPLLQLDVNGNSIFRGSFQMAPQGTATASAGQPSHSFQWQGSVYNSETHAADNLAFGFRTVPVQNDTPEATAALDLFFGPGGGTLTDTGLSIDHNGIISFATGQTLNAISANLGYASAGAIGISNTTSSTEGVVTMGGSPFISAAGSPNNAFFGLNAGGPTFTQGPYNTGIGTSALMSVTNGSDNTALGADSLDFNTSGSWNTAVGTASLLENVSGTFNSAVGYNALANTTGSKNTSLGNEAGLTNTSGSNNTFIGSGADASAANLTNATAIGANAKVGQSNTVVIGSTTSPLVEVAIGTANPAYEFEVLDTGTGLGAAAGVSTIANRAAVSGYNYATTGNATYGGYFLSQSASGAAVAAFSNSSGGTAGYFSGNVTVTGTLTKGGGSFKIDDPIDPANKYLSHSFVESPDMMNIYNGTVTLDAQGRAVVTMPNWFSALNRDFQYQLTAIGTPGPKLYIAEKMRGNTFRIAGGKKGQEVSWQVTGVRQDAWANAHRIPTEEAKPIDEHGKYLHPELYGAGPDRQIGTVPTGASSPAINANTAPTANGATAGGTADGASDGTASGRR
jgi:hypothetical protein